MLSGKNYQTKFNPKFSEILQLQSRIDRIKTCHIIFNKLLEDLEKQKNFALNHVELIL